MNCKNKVTADTAFAQLFIEMRRYRDLEHRIVTWWTTILLAIMAAFVGFGGDVVPLPSEVRWFGIGFVFLLGSAMWCLMKYSNNRYQERWKKTKEYYCHPAFALSPKPPLFENCRLKWICPSGFQITTTVMAIITLGFCGFFWWISAKGASQMNDATYIVAGINWTAWQTITLGATAIILLITLVHVKRYAAAARASAKATEDQVEATLRGQAGVFVTDPIWTVKEYPRHLGEHSGLGRSDSGEAMSTATLKHNFLFEDEWLAIEIVNEGASRAVNISLWAKWVPCSDASAEQRGDMQPAPRCTTEIVPTLNKVGDEIARWGQDFKVWRRWDLGPGESVLACLVPPGKEVCDDQRELVLTWYDPAYACRRCIIQLNKQKPVHEKQGKWTTSWNKIPPAVKQFED